MVLNRYLMFENENSEKIVKFVIIIMQGLIIIKVTIDNEILNAIVQVEKSKDLLNRTKVSNNLSIKFRKTSENPRLFNCRDESDGYSI